MRRLILLISLAFLAWSQAGPVTVADITGDGSAHKVSSTQLLVRAADITALSANAAVCRLGDSNVGASRGQVLAAGGSYHYQLGQLTSFATKDQLVDLATVYYYCGSGDKIAVHYIP